VKSVIVGPRSVREFRLGGKVYQIPLQELNRSHPPLAVVPVKQLCMRQIPARPVVLTQSWSIMRRVVRGRNFDFEVSHGELTVTCLGFVGSLGTENASVMDCAERTR
jgi:hypothetical protein